MPPDGDLPLGDACCDLAWIALHHLDREEMMSGLARPGRDRPQDGPRQPLRVARGDVPTTREPAVQARQECRSENRRMQLVQPAVEAYLDVLIASYLTVVAKPPRPLSQRLVLSEHDATITHRAEVLRRVEADPSRNPGQAGRMTVALGPRRLRAVLDHDDVMLLRQSFDPRWVQRVPVQMDWQHRADCRVRLQSFVRPIQVQPTRLVGVTPHRLGPGANDGKRRRKRGQGGRENSSTSLNSRAAQRYLQGVETAGHSHRMRSAPPLRELPLESPHLFAENQPATLADAIGGRERIVTDIPPLKGEVVRGYPQQLLDLGADIDSEAP